MKQPIVLVILILTLGAVNAYYLYLHHNSNKITTTSKGIAYEVDTKTGKTWLLTGNKKVLEKDPKPRRELVEIPYPALGKLDGTASISFSKKQKT